MAAAKKAGLVALYSGAVAGLVFAGPAVVALLPAFVSAKLGGILGSIVAAAVGTAATHAVEDLRTWLSSKEKEAEAIPTDKPQA